MTGDVENVLAADKRRALTRLQELEDEARAQAGPFEFEPHANPCQICRADAFALARDIVSGVVF